MHDVIEPIRQCFPKASMASEFFNQLNQSLEEQHKFTPANTRFAEGVCCDEINEPELQRLEQYWGERFQVRRTRRLLPRREDRPRCGKPITFPRKNGQRNLLLVGGPHIGWHDGKWGEVPRVGQVEITTSCGALMAIVEAGYAGLRSKTMDPLDSQQFLVERIMLPFLKEADGGGDVPLIAQATQFLMQRIDADLWTIVNDLLPHFEGQIACVHGSDHQYRHRQFLLPGDAGRPQSPGDRRNCNFGLRASEAIVSMSSSGPPGTRANPRPR